MFNLGFRIKYLPLDQSAEKHFGPVSKRKTAFVAILGETKKIWGVQKVRKNAPHFGALLGGPFLLLNPPKTWFLAKMLASDQSKAKYFYYVGQSCCLLILMVQVYNYITSKVCQMRFGNLIAVTLRQILRLKWVWNMQYNYISL